MNTVKLNTKKEQQRVTFGLPYTEDEGTTLLPNNSINLSVDNIV